MKKNIIIAILVMIVIGLGGFLLWQKNGIPEKVVAPVVTETTKETIPAPENLGTPSSTISNENKTVVYKTYNLGSFETEVKPYTEIIQTSNNGDRIVWTNKDSSLQSKGPAFLTNAFGENYVTFMLAGCYNCGGGFAGTVMLNASTGKFVYISDDIGNIKIDTKSESFSYQKKIAVCSLNNSCNGDPYQETKPYGTVITEKLP